MNRIKFFSRDTKPKLYPLLIITLAASVAAVIFAFAIPGSAHGWICSLIACYSLVTAVFLFRSFIEQIRYNPYSYNTIFYFGFSLFSLSAVITFSILAVRTFAEPENYRTLSILVAILESSKVYIYFSAPFLVVFSLALCISNISLIIHEGRRPVNLLGIFLSFVLIAGLIFIFTFNFYATGSQTEVMVHDLLVNIFSAIYLYFECMIIGTVVADIIASRHEPDKDRDFLIILGCGLRKDGTPTPLLKGRIDRALEFSRKQKEATGREPVFIVSGGQGSDEIVSESSSMKQYMVENGIPESGIIEENRSTNTFENMLFSKEIIDAIDPDAKISFSTTNYHVFRSGLWGRRVKMTAEGIGAKTKWYFWPNAAVREFAGLLTSHLGKQALILLSMIVFHIVLTLIVYM